MIASGVDSISTERLVEELITSTGQLLRRLRAESNPGGLTWSQTVVLSRLQNNGASTTADLARAEGVKPQSMGATMLALERDGLIVREPHPTDRRQALYRLTEFGAESHALHRLRKREWLSSAISNLDEQEKLALSTALKVILQLGTS